MRVIGHAAFQALIYNHFYLHSGFLYRFINSPFPIVVVLKFQLLRNSYFVNYFCVPGCIVQSYILIVSHYIDPRLMIVNYKKSFITIGVLLLLTYFLANSCQKIYHWCIFFRSWRMNWIGSWQRISVFTEQDFCSRAKYQLHPAKFPSANTKQTKAWYFYVIC
jgi:hypothetical protein